MKSWTKELMGQSALKRILLYFGYLQGETRKEDSDEEDDCYDHVNHSGNLAHDMDFEVHMGIWLAWEMDHAGEWRGGTFLHEKVNFAMFSFDNKDQYYWRFMPDNEDRPETVALVRGHASEHMYDERSLLYGH
jgi:hypothetical protein